jgi:hypothetical protein
MAHHLIKRQRLIAHQQRCQIQSCGRVALPRAKLCACCTAEAEYLKTCELEAITALGRINDAAIEVCGGYAHLTMIKENI